MALFGWGANSYGQLGLGEPSEQEESPRPATNSPPEPATSLCGGGGHTLVLAGGEVWSCGWNSRGQLGHGHRDNVAVFHKVPLPLSLARRVAIVACGWDFSLLATEDGDVFGCGSNAFGQLGLGEKCRGVDCFSSVPGVQDVRGIACGLRHSLFLDASGNVFGCGSSKRGQLAQDENKVFVRCVRIAAVPERISAVRAGQHFSIVLTSDGDVFGFGGNKYGQLMSSDDSSDDSSPLHKLPLPSPVKDVSCGWTHVIALLLNGDVYTWGRNNYHQLGRGGAAAHDKVMSAEKVPDLRATAISAGYEHCLAIRQSDGRLVTWGWNEHGNCGNNSVTNVPLPIEVKFPIGDPYVIRLIGAASGHNFVYIQI